MLADDDFGAQGGDPRRMTGGVQIDLSTCVNFYGPPPAVLEALRSGIDPQDLQIHPYAAAERMEAPYARHLGVPASQLVAGRGTTEFIWALSRQVRARVGRRPAAGLHRLPQGVSRPGLRRRADPVGRARRGGARRGLARDHLQPAQPQRRHAGSRASSSPSPAAIPSKILVVDESYVDFVPDPDAASVVGTDAANIVVLRSPSKFWGIAATRVGVAWCPDRERLCRPAGPPRDVADLRPGRRGGGGGDGERRVGRALPPGPRPRRGVAGRGACARCPASSSSRTSACTTAASSPSTPTSSPRGWRRTASGRARSVARTAPIRARCASWRRCRTSATRSRRGARGGARAGRRAGRRRPTARPAARGGPTLAERGVSPRRRAP